MGEKSIILSEGCQASPSRPYGKSSKKGKEMKQQILNKKERIQLVTLAALNESCEILISH
jgi:hypothetical protein